MGSNHVAYDYFSTEVPSAYEHIYNDCYESLGWEYMESLHIHTNQNSGQSNGVRLQYRRAHTIENRGRLVELQKECEAQLKNIQSLEQWADTLGMIVAIAIGVIGAGLVALAVILFRNAHFVWAVLLGMIGLAGCTVAFPLFLKIKKQKENDTMSDVDVRREKLQLLRLKAIDLRGEKE